MKTILSILILSFAVSVAADDRGCVALTEELGMKPALPGQQDIKRRVILEGKSKDDVECRIAFVPDFCTFELGAPFDQPEMYYLKDTSYSSIKISYSNNNRFSFKAVTKESTDDWGQVTKTLRIERAEKGGYEIKYDMKEGRFFKNDAKSFRCNVNVSGNS